MVRRHWPTLDDVREARRHRRQAKRHGRAGGSLVGIRVAELERVFTDRYGESLPDDDTGRDDLFVLLNHCAWFADGQGRMRQHAVAWAPWCTPDILDDLIAEVMARPVRWTADKLAARLSVDDATRTRLGLRTIGAIDVTAEQRRVRRLARDRLAKQRIRHAKGVSARPDRHETIARRAPWRALGVSRATWYRWRRRDRETAKSAA
jgi:hypothetical protein